MSNLVHDITQQAGAHKKPTRIGRGDGSKGKTSGRGHKGAGARAGFGKRIGFEGGQTEIYRRFPLRGFSNKPFETKYNVVNLADLNRFDDGATVDQAALKEAGLIPNTHLGVKVLGRGELSKKLTVVAAAYSRSAHKAITDSGGTAQDTDGQPFAFREPRNKRLQRKLDKRLAALGIEATSQPGSGSADTPAKPAGNEGDAAGEQSRGKPASGKPTGEDAPVTEAPESGDKDEQ